MLTIDNVCKKFDHRVILDDLSFEVADGSIFGLVGVNGSGKSTLLRLISGIYEPEGGSICLNGLDTYKDVEVRKDIVFVSDEPYYPFGANIETLKEFYSSFYDLDEEAYLKNLKLFGLDPKRSISNFSKGMKRQTSLLFALAIHPKLLLLDEAFDGLDPVVRLNFKKALADLLEDEQISVIISSHNLKELEDICDSYGILENGKVTTYGDLLQSKENVNKYQLAFREDLDKDDFNGFEVLSFEKLGQVYTLVIKGDREETEAKLQQMQPLLCNVLPVNFEELFIYEVESRGK